MSSVSSDSPMTLKTCPRTASPTGTVMPRPVWRTTAPRTRPSVGFMQTQRTRPSPICWATSPVTVIVAPSMTMSTSMAWLISGNECGGNSTSTTGPAIATTRPVSRVVFSGAMVIGFSLSRAERFSAAHDFHDFGGDRVLTGSVHNATEVLSEFVGVVGGGRHRALLTDVEGGCPFQERGEYLALECFRGERGQQLRDLGFELGVTLQDLGTVVLRQLGHGQREKLLYFAALGGRGMEPRRDEEDLLGVTVDKRFAHLGGDLTSVLERWTIRHADESVNHVDATETVEGTRLLADTEELNVGAIFFKLSNQAFPGAQRRRVVGTGESAVARQH